MGYDTTTSVTDNVTDNLASYHNQLKTAIDHVMSSSPYSAYVTAASMTGNVTLTDSDYPIQSYSPTAARDLTLPAVASTNHAFFVYNRSGTYAITVKNAGGTTIGTVTAGTSGMFFSDGTNGWTTISGGSSSGGDLENYLINGGFRFFQRISPSTATTMTDDAYNAPDRWNSLIQGSGATINRNAGIGTSQYSCKLVAGGTTNRYGIEQIIEAENSIPLRGKTVIAQCLLKPVNNAGSGSRNYRIAIVEWTGTADTVTSDIVNTWTSSTYTTGNFFNTTSLTVVGTATVSATHNTETQLSVSGSVSTSCNNLIVFIWAQDVPTHASDYVLIGEAGLYVSSSVQAWKPKLLSQEELLCKRFFLPLSDISVGTTHLHPAPGYKSTSAILDINVAHVVDMFATPTLIQNSVAFASGPTSGGNNVGWFNAHTGAWFVATGAVTFSYTNASKKAGNFRATAATSMDGTLGDVGIVYFGGTARVGLEAEL